jgi:predicted aldo/keto reductase-like oxidoreductase
VSDLTRFTRRDFLRGAAGAGLALGAVPSAAADEPNHVRRYVRLGRTGLEISDVSFGSSRLSGDEGVVHHALARGVNYFDTAESYTQGQSEETLGRALAGRRESVHLASKVKCEARTSRGELMERLEGSLRRLRTDRIEIYFNHAVNDVGRLRNPEWGEFTARAKEQGKIRFTGMSGHGGLLVRCLDQAVENDLVDVVLVGYNFGQDPGFLQQFTETFDFVARQPELPRVLAKAKERDVGVVAMKTLMGGRLNDLRPFETAGSTYAQAAFRWTLSSPHVDALVVSMKSREMIDEYLGGSGWEPPSAADAALLRRYHARNGASQCRQGCGACHAACPHGVEVGEVLRARMYSRDQGDHDLGRADYAALSAGAAACVSCDGAPCAGACGYGLEIAPLTRDAHRLLS